MPEPDARITTPLAAFRSPDQAAVLRIDAAFLDENQDRINWLLERLKRSTAGIRGRLCVVATPTTLTLEQAEQSPELTPTLVALIAQAYANHLRSRPEGRQSAFVGFDARFLSAEFGDIFTRVLLGNGIRVARDRGGQPTATPVTSFMANYLGLGAGIQITASHNPPSNNGIKSSTHYGGVDTDDVSAQIAAQVKELATAGGEIRLAARPSGHTDEYDAKALYGEHYLRATFPPETVEPLRQALDSGAEFLFDGLHGVGGATMIAYLDAVLERGDWEGRVHLLNETPDPTIGGIARPDPGDPGTLELSGAIKHLVNHPRILVSVTADMDADRIGTAVIIPVDRVADARALGLFVSEFRGQAGSVWALRFTPNQIFTLLAYDRLRSALRQQGEAPDPARLHVLSTIATTQLAQRVAATLGATFHAAAVGFKNLGKLAYDLDQERTGQIPIILMEESGGAQVGPFAPWNARGDTIHRDKDTCALALALFCLASRLHLEERSLLDSYRDLIEATDVIAYFERLDVFLPDQPTAEDPSQAAAAGQIKLRLLDRLMALAKPSGEPELCRLLGFEPSQPIGSAPEPLTHVSLLLPVDGGWQWRSPTPRRAVAADGSRLEWYLAGPLPHDGLAVTCYAPNGQTRWWCLVRASGTEPILRVYMEVLERPAAPHPERLIDVFTPLLRHLGLDEYRLEPGADDYVTSYQQAVRSKYGV